MQQKVNRITKRITGHILCIKCRKWQNLKCWITFKRRYIKDIKQTTNANVYLDEKEKPRN